MHNEYKADQRDMQEIKEKIERIQNYNTDPDDQKTQRNSSRLAAQIRASHQRQRKY